MMSKSLIQTVSRMQSTVVIVLLMDEEGENNAAHSQRHAWSPQDHQADAGKLFLCRSGYQAKLASGA